MTAQRYLLNRENIEVVSKIKENNDNQIDHRRWRSNLRFSKIEVKDLKKEFNENEDR